MFESAEVEFGLKNRWCKVAGFVVSMELKFK
jgi:hypothetical protein